MDNPYEALRRIEELATFRPASSALERLETLGRIQMLAWQALNRQPKPLASQSSQTEEAAA